MSANSLRGEVTITLEGVDYVLRPDFTAITAIEDQTRQSLQQLAVDADAGRLPLRVLGTVVAECMKGQGRATGNEGLQATKAERVTELLFEAGVLAVSPRVALVLAMALTGGHRPKEPDPGEAKAAGKTRPKKTAATPAAS